MKEKEKMLDKKILNFKSKKITKKKSLQEKGITLIALVVTIIILLILAGVTLNIALSDNGLFSKTQEAAEKYKQAQSDEEEMVRQIATQMYSEYVGAEISGYTPTGKETCTIGTDTSGYTTSQDIKRETLEWKIWDFDGNILRIVGSPTKQPLYLDGAAGYNNGIWALDHICKELYSNGRNGVTPTTLKRSDIQKISTYDYTSWGHEKSTWNGSIAGIEEENIIRFGQTGKYKNDVYYPDLWDKCDKNWTYEYNSKTGKDFSVWEDIGTKDGLNVQFSHKENYEEQFKQSFYFQRVQTSDLINEKYYSLIYEQGKFDCIGDSYWLGTRGTYLFEDKCHFGLGRVSWDGGYPANHCCGIYKSDGKGTENPLGYGIRPIVSIDLNASNCTMTQEAKEDGTVKYILNFA